MRYVLSTSMFALSVIWSLPSQAAIITYDALPANGSFYAPTATASTGAYASDVTGSVPSLRTSPFGDTTTHYNSVGADGSATFGTLPFSEDATLFNAAVVTGPSSGSFGSGSGTFSFVWGTPDTYNKLTFFNTDGSLTTMFGSGTGSGSYLATVSGLGTYTAVKFESLGQNAFEFAAVSPVPLPASLPMFGAAVLALGGIGAALRGRRAVVAQAVA